MYLGERDGLALRRGPRADEPRRDAAALPARPCLVRLREVLRCPPRRRSRGGRDLDDIAETVAPACSEWERRGFTDEGVAELEAFLAGNMRAVMDAAASVLGDDEDLAVMELELDRDAALMIERAACSEGVSPAESIGTAVGYMIETVKSGDEPFITMLREG